jgi:hypothetical protein
MLMVLKTQSRYGQEYIFFYPSSKKQMVQVPIFGFDFVKSPKGSVATMHVEKHLGNLTLHQNYFKYF